jgi:hypothetical protein
MGVVESRMREPTPTPRPPSPAPFVALGVLLALLISDALQQPVGPGSVPARGWTLVLTTASVFIVALVLTRVQWLLGSVLLSLCISPLLTYGIAVATIEHFQRADLTVRWLELSLASAGPLAGLFFVRVLAFKEDRGRAGSWIQALDARAVWFGVVGVASATALFVSSLPVDPTSPPRTQTLSIALLGTLLSFWFVLRNSMDLLRLLRIGRRLGGMSPCDRDTPATATLDLGVGDLVFVPRSGASAYRTGIAAERIVGSYPAARRIAVSHFVVGAAALGVLGFHLHASLHTLLPQQLREDVLLLSDLVTEAP